MSLALEGFFSASQLRRWMEALPRRFSCRDFAAPADTGQLAALEYTAARVSLPGIRIEIEKSGAERLVFKAPLFPAFRGLSQYAVILAEKGLEHAALKSGICGEAFVLELTHQGLQGCWMTGNYRRPQAAQSAAAAERVMAVIPFGVPTDPDGARLSRRRILTSFSPDDPTLWPYWAYHAAEAMRAAPSAVNRQPWRVSFSGNTLRFEGRKPDSIDSGIALTHLECALREHPHTWRPGSDGRSYLARLEDTHEPV